MRSQKLKCQIPLLNMNNTQLFNFLSLLFAIISPRPSSESHVLERLPKFQKRKLPTDLNLLSAGVAEALDIAGAQFSDLIREGGWNLQDSLLYCKYRGKLCDESVSESR